MNVSKPRLLLLALIVIVVTISVTFTIFLISNPDPSTIDSDDDGVMDDTDAFPNDPHEHNDSDNDGVGDNEDDFPLDPAASLDSDGDGYPDRWNTGKTQSDSTSNPPLVLDEVPYDPTEWKDSDKDGIGDNADVFPNDPTESRDDDHDGTGNNADQNPFVNLSFTFSLNQITLNKHVDILPWAQVYIKILINGNEYVTWDNGGKYYYIWKNRPKAISKTFSYDIPETGSQNFTDITIQVFDHDILKKDVQLDINQDSEQSSIHLRVYHSNNKLVPESAIGGMEANIEYSITLPEEVEPTDNSIEKTYRWRFLNTFHTITLDIPIQKYVWAVQSNVNRSPQQLGTQSIRAMANFATVNDTVLVSLADELSIIASKNGYNAIETVNFVMSFVQQNIQYLEDNASKNQEEYWRYPIETLVDEQGDCEDTSILFSSLIENLDYDAVLLFYIIDDTIGHLATGVAGVNIPGGFFVPYLNESYYYCETTSVGFTVGEKPEDVPDTPEKIIQIG